MLWMLSKVAIEFDVPKTTLHDTPLVPTLSKEYLFKPPFSYTVGHLTVLLHKPLRTNGRS
jgi:hypothetical protein